MKRLVLAHTNGPLAGLRRIVGRADVPEDGFPAEMIDRSEMRCARTFESDHCVVYAETFAPIGFHARHAYLRGA